MNNDKQTRAARNASKDGSRRRQPWSAEVREAVQGRFARHGIEASRLDLRAFSGEAQMMAEYGDIDIALDPFPYNGSTTADLPALARLRSELRSRFLASPACDGERFARAFEGLCREAWGRFVAEGR